MPDPLVLVTAVLALVLAYVNGFHDASNAVSTTITTRTLREGTALAMAATLNILGALLGVGLAEVTGGWALDTLGLPEAATSPDVVWILLAGLVAAILWDLATWWMGMPSSTWHALLGGIAGASLILGWAADWSHVLLASLLTTAFAPLLGAAAAYGLMHGIVLLMTTERVTGGHLRFLQTTSAGAVAAVHGVQDSLLPMSVIVVLSLTGGLPGGFVDASPYLVALLIGLGTLAGGRRIIRTIGTRLTELTTTQGFAAEASTATLLAVAALGVGVPVSSSHSLSSSVIGAGLARGPRALRWSVVARIVGIWVATPFVCFGLGLVLARLVVTSGAGG